MPVQVATQWCAPTADMASTSEPVGVLCCACVWAWGVGGCMWSPSAHVVRVVWCGDVGVHVHVVCGGVHVCAVLLPCISAD